MIRRIRFTCIGKGHGAPCLPATKEDWENLRRESWLAQMCARIEKGDDEIVCQSGHLIALSLRTIIGPFLMRLSH